jgi:hypothetical protein
MFMPLTRISTRVAKLASALVLLHVSACSSSSGDARSSDGDAGVASPGGRSASGGSTSTGSTNTGSTSTGSTAGGGKTGSGGTGTPSGGGGLGGQTLAGLDGGVVSKLCGGNGCACSNGIDDDGDGQIDGFDTECTGPLDNDEGTFATGIPGDNKDPKWQDCFFDGNSGAGDDRCRYPTGCLTGAIDAHDAQCALTQSCLDFCMDRTPNGCDCFGCCTIGSGAAAVDVQIQGSCSTAKLDDAKACPRCTKSLSCNNTCGTCELCPGKTAADLPASCTPPPPPADGGKPPPYTPPPNNTCDLGRTPCANQSACAANEYCQQGCCVVIVR